MSAHTPRTVPRELVKRLATRAPRYTSYPTAPHFTQDFDRQEALARWRHAPMDPQGRISLYVHVPFCARRCRYCGCHTEIGHTRKEAGVYVESLLNEAALAASRLHRRAVVAQLALGGGTPTFLQPKDMTRLVTGLAGHFDFAPDAERSIEIDPRSVTPASLDNLLDLGFNRMSLGVQDLDEDVQTYIGRIQPYAMVAGLVEHLKSRGMTAINMDLIYGLPGQSVEGFSRTIGRVADMGPSRIALFGYAHVPWVSPHQQAMEVYGIPGEELRMDLLAAGYEGLLAAGFLPVGMDHFARPGDELLRALEHRSLTRNFMGYTTRRGLDLVGLGASAISAVAGTYTQNEKNLQEYSSKADHDPWSRGLVMTGEDLLRREVILDLFCNFHLDFAPLNQRFGVDFATHFAPELERLKAHEADGLVEVGGQAITVTDLGRFFIRNLCLVFDQYLGGDTSRYSKTH